MAATSTHPAASWGTDLPELGGLSPAALDPGRVERAVRDGYEAGHAAGLADGHAAGYAAGYDAGAEAGRVALEDERQQVEALLGTLGAQLRQLDGVDTALRAAFEAHVVDAALLVAEAVLGRELAVATDPGRDALVRALAVAPTGIAAATVRLHPADVERLGALGDLAPGVELTVVADPGIEPGGCVLRIGETSIDASIKAALARVREVLS